MGSDEPDPDEAGHRLASMIGLVFGGLMHAIVGVFVLSSGLVAPAWAVLPLILVWVTGGWLLWRLRRTPLFVLLVPVGTAATWWLAITLGEQFLGWTA